jgi:acylpyruvate hydrolase
LKLATFALNGEPRLGAIVWDSLVDLSAACEAGMRTGAIPANGGTLPSTMMEFLAAGEAADRLAGEALTYAGGAETLHALHRVGLAVEVSRATYLPPIARPSKIICVGRNYKEHAQEMGGDPLPQYPTLFAKFSNTLVGHRAPIVLPACSSMVDYEAELAVVIGRRGRNIPAQAAMSHVAGCTIFNDVSVRDFQRRTPQWLQGKTFDGAGPCGPFLVTLDELKNPDALDVRLKLNGEVMQNSNTSQFIFRIPQLIEYISQVVTLEPGDIIATGTPSGVGFARNPQVFLKPGDLVEIEIEGLGILQNPVVGPA